MQDVRKILQNSVKKQKERIISQLTEIEYICGHNGCQYKTSSAMDLLNHQVGHYKADTIN